jgi:hypothetical protein
MPLFESQAVVSCSCIPKPMFYFPGDLVGPDPSSAVLPSVLYFPGLMRARRLRLHRHRMSSMSRWSCWSRWSLVLAAVVKLLFPGWRSCIPALAKSYLFPEIWIHPGTPLCSSQVFSSGDSLRLQLPRLRCVLYYIFRAKGPFRLDSKTVNSGNR